MRKRIVLVAFVVVWSVGVASAPAGTAPQDATADDMKLFEHYVGHYRSPAYTFDDGKTDYFNRVDYVWFDPGKTIVKFTVATVIPSMDRIIVTAEGFYGYDPFHHTLYVFGAFSNGTTGWGVVGSFDRETGKREVWANSMGADSIVTHVRDEFEPVDADSWRNRTSVRRGDETDWTVVHEAIYTREMAE